MSGKFKNLDDFLSLLQKVKKIGNNEYQALCPAHTDRTPSLHISLNDGKILINCKAGCQTPDVVKALNLTMADLFIGDNRLQPATQGLGTLIATYIYQDSQRKPLFEVLRYEPKTFRQRHYDKLGKPAWGLGTIKPVLYHLPDVEAASKNGDVIYLVEGEKDADILWNYGLIATTNPMGAGKWKPEYTATLKGAKVVVIPDKDEAGRQHAKEVARQLEAKAEWVKVIELPGVDVKDVADWLEQEGDTDDLVKMVDNQPRFSTLATISAVDLLKKHFPPVKWVIPDLLPDGTTLLCGKPKAGKSVLVLNICLAVSSGGKALGGIQVEQGDVLYLSLEDGERRVKERLDLLLEGGSPPLALDIACQWGRIDEGGITDIEIWLKRHPNARLIAVDTLKRIKPKENVGMTLYGQDYDSVLPLGELAKKWGVGIIVNHHLNKMRDADDPMDLISGSTGLTGGVDTACVIKRGRGEADAVMHIVGRDVEDKKLAMRMDYPSWTLLGDADEYTASQERQEITEYLRDNPDSKPKQVADGLAKSPNATKYLMWKMSKDGMLSAEGGKYRVI